MFTTKNASLRHGRSGVQIPVEVWFSLPVQTGHEAQLASYTMGTRSFAVVEKPRAWLYPPTPSGAEPVYA